jgi:hypothetical protein
MTIFEKAAVQIVRGVLLVGVGFALGGPSYGQEKGQDKVSEKLGTVRYKSGKEVRFDEVLIRGQLQRPEILVVTGDSGQSSDGLLRLREDFLDHITQDFGENIQ